MPSFDVVSEINRHELTNALDQTRREVENRFDFRGTNTRIEAADLSLTLIAPAPFQLGQLLEILKLKLAKRGIDISSLKIDAVTSTLAEARQGVTVREGIDAELGRKIIRMLQEARLRVQAQMQAAQVRVSGRQRDDLQAAIGLLRSAKLDLPLQFRNFRD